MCLYIPICATRLDQVLIVHSKYAYKVLIVFNSVKWKHALLSDDIIQAYEISYI